MFKNAYLPVKEHIARFNITDNAALQPGEIFYVDTSQIMSSRKRTHFTSRKEQGEIPVKWSDSRNRQLYLGGEAYGSQLLS